MHRRDAVKRAMFFAVALALGKMDLLKAQDGQLTVPLDAYNHVVFIRKGKRIAIPVDEIFNALLEP